MRNLKRALSLALAAAMLIGMMVVGASAAEYKDADSIKNTEAVEVLTGLGVVGGSNGSFNPEKTLTRAEFCVMIANALTGGKFDPALFDGTNTPFTDINGHWGAAYIAYCYSAGVIAGTGDGTTFSPNKTLTAAQAEAILLSALGYNKNGEFAVNGQFDLNVTNWATQAGLLKGLSVSASKGITRDAMAKVLFNALTNTTPVGYSKLAETYYTVGSPSLNGVVYTGKDLDPADPAGTYYGETLGYKNFGLEYGAAVEDDFNRPAHQWISTNNSNIGVYANAPTFTYTAATKESVVKADLKGYTVSSVNTYTNGNDTATVTAAVTDVDNLTGNGKKVEIYTNAAKVVTDIVVIETYLAKANANYDAEKDELALTIQSTIALNSSTVKAEDFAAAADVKKDDYVLITVTKNGANYDVASLAPATKVEKANVSVYKTNDNVTAAGVNYKYNATAKADSSALGYATMTGTYTLGSDYNLYLDQYGYVIGVEPYSGTIDLSNYAFVANVGTSGFDNIAKLVLTDGTSKNVVVSKTAAVGGTLTAVTTQTASSYTNGNLASGSFVTFDTDKDGKYELTYVTTVNPGDKAINYATYGAAAIDTVTAAGTTSTVFVAKDKAYTGVANAPVVTTGGGNAVYYTVDNNGYLKLVYTPKAGVGVTSTSELVYILSTTGSVGKDADKNTYYVYDAIVNGEKSTVKANNSSVTAGLNKIDSYTKGYADLTPITSTGTKYVVESSASAVTYNNSTLKVNSTYYTVADTVSVYTIDTTDNNAVASIGTGSIEYKYSNSFDDITLVFDKDYSAFKDAKVVTIYMQK